MDLKFLDFEQPIAELEAKIDELRHVEVGSEVNIAEEIDRLQKKSKKLTQTIFSNLSPWQVSQVARHPQRPYSLDYIERIFDEFEELHGDRMYADDPALVGGLARMGDVSLVVIGHQKGRDTKEKIARNFGMPRPEGYRKALRLMQTAEKFEPAHLDYDRYPGRLSRRGRGGTGPERGYRPQPVCHGGLAHARDLGGGGRGRFRRRAGHRRV
jgi:acetyl-CoA carboxylase carboxyl transferase subunit alpha